MGKTQKFFLGACLAGAFGTASAIEPIATVMELEGSAVVSQGSEYVKAHVGMRLQEGDRFLAMQDGSAVIAFDDGCKYQMTDQEVLVIGSMSTCASDAAGSYQVDAGSAVAEGASVSYKPAGAPGKGGTAAMGASGVVPIVAAALIAGLAISEAGSDNDREPASP